MNEKISAEKYNQMNVVRRTYKFKKCPSYCSFSLYDRIIDSLLLNKILYVDQTDVVICYWYGAGVELCTRGDLILPGYTLAQDDIIRLESACQLFQSSTLQLSLEY